MQSLAEGREEALAPIFGRYAPLVYHIAAQSLGTAAAEDLVQEVFFSVWSKATSFEREKGLFRPWLLQIVHFKVLNELRRRSRGPQAEPDADGQLIDGLPSRNEGPVEEAWLSYRSEAVRAAVDRLPQAQRQALSLAFFEDLTHDQVASALKLPLGTVKTRIRGAVKELRRLLVPYGLAVLLIGGLAVAGFGLRSIIQTARAQLVDRALSFVTASDITTLHLAAAPGQAPGQAPRTHGSYRGRAGTALAVMALHDFPPAPAGKVYQGWALIGGVWVSVGKALPDKDGNALLIGEAPALAALPEAVEATLEPSAGSPSPSGPVIIEWSLAPASK
jgi:RNA polymerase sigma-70 factor (ECF subfamily)